jgi:hypothetical protein
MKIYVITKGCYSDYHIAAVTDDKEKAEFLKLKFSDEYDPANIEEYDTDEYSVEGIQNMKLFYWKVSISHSQSVVYPYLSGNQYFNVYADGIQAVVIARTKEQAIKIVRDKYAQYLSEQAEKQVDNIFKVFDEIEGDNK